MESERVLITKEKVGRIGDAIREKTSTTGGIELDDMPDLIRSISGGGGGGDHDGIMIKSIINETIVRTLVLV